MPVIKTAAGSGSTASPSQKPPKLKQFGGNSGEVRRDRSELSFFKRAKYFRAAESGADMLFYDLGDCVSSLRKSSSSGSGCKSPELDEVLSNNDKIALEGEN